MEQFRICIVMQNVVNDLTLQRHVSKMTNVSIDVEKVTEGVPKFIDLLLAYIAMIKVFAFMLLITSRLVAGY